jgi:hypothetical protein
MARKYKKRTLSRASKPGHHRKFGVGDEVKVIGLPRITFAPGVKDELGTVKLFRSMLGKVYTIRGFGKYGFVELEPKRLNSVWIEPEFLKLRARKKKKTL